MATAISKSISKATGQSSDTVIDPHDTAKYLLRVTAGPDYDPSTHGLVQVNGAPYSISSSRVDATVKVRIRDYHGLPRSSPSTHAYFSSPQHRNDRYSISFAFTPKEDIPGEDLIMGFDFDRPIRDRLPPLFKPALRLVTTVIDPGIYCDAYADEPYIYGAALSSFYLLKIGNKPERGQSEDDEAQHAEETRPPYLQRATTTLVSEGAVGNGELYRSSHQIPENSEKRRKYFLKPDNLKSFTFEKGREYETDFFNPYLDFANFAVKLPGFSIGVARYIDEKTHTLRYVLKNKRTGEIYFAVVFTLLFGQELKDALAEEGLSAPTSEASSLSASRNTSFSMSSREPSINIQSSPSSRSPSPPVSAEQTDGMLSTLGKWIPRMLRSGGTVSGSTSPDRTGNSASTSRRGSGSSVASDGKGEAPDGTKVEAMLREKFGSTS